MNTEEEWSGGRIRPEEVVFSVSLLPGACHLLPKSKTLGTGRTASWPREEHDHDQRCFRLGTGPPSSSGIRSRRRWESWGRSSRHASSPCGEERNAGLVVGTSVGSLNGAVIAAGPTSAATVCPMPGWGSPATRSSRWAIAQAHTLQRSRNHLFPNTGLAELVADLIGMATISMISLFPFLQSRQMLLGPSHTCSRLVYFCPLCLQRGHSGDLPFRCS